MQAAMKTPDVLVQELQRRKHAVLRRMLQCSDQNADEASNQALHEIKAVLDYVNQLKTAAEYFTAKFMCEDLFLPSHLHVIAQLSPRAFREYIEATLADESERVALARDMILRYAKTPETQQLCRDVANHLTELFLKSLAGSIEPLGVSTHPRIGQRRYALFADQLEV